MATVNSHSSRRRFLHATSLAAVASGLGLDLARPTNLFADDPPISKKLPRIAAINSIYRFRSHAYHICGRFIHGYRRNGFPYQSQFQLARMYNHQYPKDDLSRDHCPKHNIELSSSVANALGGPKGLDVDAVLLIIEHGDYKENKYRQVLYPRYELFQEIVEVFRKSGRSVPVFVDKHLSYDHQQAAKMVQTARELKFGLMAGSSLPVTWRRPEIEPPLGTPFTEGLVTFGFDRGPPEIYFFHALETLQCMLERRAGGESGVKSVTCLEGDAVWKAADEGRWSWQLLHAAIARCPSNNIGDVRYNVRNPQAILIEYQDGTRGTAINLIEQVSEFGFAATVKGRLDPLSTLFYLSAAPRASYFDALSYNIEQFFAGGTPPYPVERTLLTSTVLDLAMRSLHDRSETRHDDALRIRYTPPANSGFFRGPYVDAT